jgi:hypothetical protein
MRKSYINRRWVSGLPKQLSISTFLRILHLYPPWLDPSSKGLNPTIKCSTVIVNKNPIPTVSPTSISAESVCAWDSNLCPPDQELCALADC